METFASAPASASEDDGDDNGDDGDDENDADALEKLNETGELRNMFKHFKRVSRMTSCDQCGGYRYIPCTACHGSKKSLHRNDFTAEFCSLRCIVCNENGLVRCDGCLDATTRLRPGWVMQTVNDEREVFTADATCGKVSLSQVSP
ncbi:hypothetical protein LSAT2_023878 [Lamellibrachia satsuma]|nr:hypothetical protein LSAT2_023878 [Lamellibrachia satsuma]